MTSDERKQFLYDTIFGSDTLNEAIDKIAARWDDDSDEVFQRGQDVFRESTIRY